MLRVKLLSGEALTSIPVDEVHEREGLEAAPDSAARLATPI